MIKTLPSKFPQTVKKQFLLFVLTLGMTQVAAWAAPSSYDYRSIKSGDWNDPTTWSVRAKGATSGAFTQLAASATADIPDATAGTINIVSGHIVTVSANQVADQVSVNGV